MCGPIDKSVQNVITVGRILRPCRGRPKAICAFCGFPLAFYCIFLCPRFTALDTRAFGTRIWLARRPKKHRQNKANRYFVKRRKRVATGLTNQEIASLVSELLLLLLLLLCYLCCCYSSGVPWTIKARDARRIIAAEKKLLLLLLFHICCCFSSGVPRTNKARDTRRIRAAEMKLLLLLLLFHLCCCYSSGVPWTIKARDARRITAAEMKLLLLLLFHLCCCYSSGVPWTNKARDTRRITAAEMKYITAGYTWRDHKTNTQIEKGIKNNTNSG